jgi:hypothetical protein
MSKVMDIRKHHKAWLDAHPHRTLEWLKERTSDGFDIHHVDGDRENNAPENLVMIECSDHMMLHGSRMLRLSAQDKRRACRPKISKDSSGDYGVSAEKIAEWQSRSRILISARGCSNG